MTWVYILSLWVIVAVVASLLLGRMIGVCSEDRRRALVSPPLLPKSAPRQRISQD
jgi:hypothetical protein